MTFGQLDLRFQGTTPIIHGRAVCVLDKVSQQDHDGHAALEYSESQEELTPKQKSKCRPLIQADLADAFGEILSLDPGFSDPIE